MRLKLMLVAAMLSVASLAQAQGGTIGGGGGGACCSAATVTPKDSVRFTGTTSAIVGGTGNMTIRAGTGNSRQMILAPTNAAGTPISTLTVTDSQVRIVPPGRAGRPVLALNNSTTTGFYSLLGDTIGFALGGTLGFRVHAVGGVGAYLMGGAGNMNIQAGTGNSRTMTLQTTTSAGTLKNSLVLGADTSATFLGRIIANGLPSESGTFSAICDSSGVLQVNAAATCTVSARRFKENIVSLNDSVALTEILALRPVTYREKNGHVRHIGLVAEEADSVDHRLATFDAAGRINSVNYEQVTVLLLSAVQQQQRDITLLRDALLGIVGAAGVAGAGLAAKKKLAPAVPVANAS